MNTIYNKNKIQFSDLNIFKDAKTLFISDFRGTGESLDLDIPAMWKYENLLIHLVQNGYILCNEDAEKINQKKNLQNRIILKKGDDPKIPLIEKIDKLDDVEKIWTVVPHPKIDLFAEKNKLDLNYSYADFLKFNNKISQKIACGDFTPKWKKINDTSMNIDGNLFIKRALGSGGYCVWDNNSEILFEKGHEYFWEEKVEGNSSSVQVYSSENENIIFGYSHQLIQNDKEFCGAKILEIDQIPQYCFDKICEIIELLKKDLLKNYEGFWGIDFIDNPFDKKIWFLEANVRLTALTVPTLLKNTYFQDKNTEFLEDAPELKRDDLLIAIDDHYKTYDVLRFHE